MTSTDHTSAAHTNTVIHQPATLEHPSDCETLLTRMFDAPPHLVFDAWTKTEFVQRWYGMRDFKTTTCEIDLRVGGKWRWVQTMPDGGEVGFSGKYREIDRPHRLVFSEEFEAMPGTEYLVTLDFADQNGKTKLTTHMLYKSQEHRDGHLQSGMEWGTNEVYARLDELFATQV
jgi:uncharacterized protein YndB with AHSA1/START domain